MWQYFVDTLEAYIMWSMCGISNGLVAIEMCSDFEGSVSSKYHLQ